MKSGSVSTPILFIFLNLQLIILDILGGATVNVNMFWISSSTYLCFDIEEKLTFTCQPCIPYLFYNHLLVLGGFFFFFAYFFNFSTETVMLSANKEGFISSFPICISLVSFSFLIVLAGTTSRMLKSSGEREHPCLVPDLSRKVWVFHHELWC